MTISYFFLKIFGSFDNYSYLCNLCTPCLAPCDANMPKANEVDINANIYPMAAESDENNKQ